MCPATTLGIQCSHSATHSKTAVKLRLMHTCYKPAPQLSPTQLNSQTGSRSPKCILQGVLQDAGGLEQHLQAQARTGFGISSLRRNISPLQQFSRAGRYGAQSTR
jgi:hypothetical protein